jgi:hypothetical protein
MTRHKSFKRLVRTRMDKTGESYAAARVMLLAAQETRADRKPPLATSDEEITRRTGRGWEAWFDLLDEWGAADRPHRDRHRPRRRDRETVRVLADGAPAGSPTSSESSRWPGRLRR